MSDLKKNLLLFFDRPLEPCFMQKGDDKTVFQIPEYFFPKKYRSLKSIIEKRFCGDAGRKVQVRDMEIPNLEGPMELAYDDQFSLFVPKHCRIAGQLIDLFLSVKDSEDLTSLCSYCQLRINPYMFNYCLSVAILHRPDTKDINIPLYAQCFPDKYMDPRVFRGIRELTSVVPTKQRMPVTIPVNYTASDLEPEQHVAYFREDVGVNLHHWHWHLVYPFDSANRAIVDKDRRGELFYYMHHQIIARFNVERLCNSLGLVKPYSDLHAPISEAYFPKLDSLVANRSWPSRFANTMIHDVERREDEAYIEISEMENWRSRIMQAIETKTVLLTDGRLIPLEEENGIDVLGNIMEASIISPNVEYYGSFHNKGHLLIGYAHDPDYRYLEPFAVMGDSATAMRDPVFYRWHAYIDNIFDFYKSKLPAYNKDNLEFAGVRVTSVGIEGRGGSDTITTLWEQSTVELERGMDFMPRGSVLAKFTHLQHEEFTYVIKVNNTSEKPLMGMVRVFMAPVLDENGQPLALEAQRRLMIEMDKFSQALSPGKNTIRRQSVDSSVTIPYDRTFRDKNQRRYDPNSAEADDFNFCGCGWPQHMLTPKGTSEGYPMVLFVMITNWNKDKIDQDTVGTCVDAASFCGLRDRKYPDRRPMGFPFDRPAPSANTLSDFLRPNMAIQECKVHFTGRTRPHGQ